MSHPTLTPALLRRVIELDEAGAPAIADDGLAADDEASLRAAQQRLRARLLEWVGDPECMLHVASAAGLDALTCFEDAHRHAGRARARLVVVTELVLERDAHSPPGVPLRAHLLELAQRNGWRHVDTLDLHIGVQRFRDGMLAAAERNRLPLAREGFDMQATLAHLHHRRDALAAGSVHVEALRFERSTAAAAATVRIDAARAEAMRSLFASVFGHEMSPEHWRWKYGQGRGQAVGLVEGGALVAHYGGLTRQLLAMGKSMIGCQVCDVMVTPSANRSLLRRGPLHQVAATFLETQIGHALPHDLGYGFPSLRHHQLAERLGLYAAVDRVVQLRWTAIDAPHLRRLNVEALQAREQRIGPRLQREIDDVWQAMAGAMRECVLGVRDHSWLQWRYLDHPHITYRVILVRSRWMRHLQGVAVLRERDDASELLDLVAHPRDFGVLLALARSLAHQSGKPELRAWITSSQQQWLIDAAGSPSAIDDVGIVVPANVHTPGPSPALVENRWFLMAGDADFT